MKRATLLPVIALVGSLFFGCQMVAGAQSELMALRQQKLGKAVFELAPWCTDFDEARARAKAEGKVILAYFTRSYAR